MAGISSEPYIVIGFREYLPNRLLNGIWADAIFNLPSGRHRLEYLDPIRKIDRYKHRIIANIKLSYFCDFPFIRIRHRDNETAFLPKVWY